MNDSSPVAVSKQKTDNPRVDVYSTHRHRKHPARFVSLGLMVGVGLFLSGCQGGSSTSTNAFSDGIKSATSLVTNQPGPQFADMSVKRLAPRVVYASSPAQSSLDYAMADTVAVANAPMQRYMARIADRLMAHWDGFRPDTIGLFVSPEDQINAKATVGNDILISIRAVNAFKTEDQLAAIMAHELGHVLLRHHRDERAVRTATNIAAAAAVGFVMAKAVSRLERRKTASGVEFYTPLAAQKQNGRDMLNSMGALVAGIVIVSDVGLSWYNRRQEYIADRFSIEMLHHAGYDPAAMLDVLELLRRSHVAKEKKTQRHKFTASSIEGLFAQGALALVSEIGGKLNETHPDPAKRLTAARAHIREVIGDATSPEQRIAGLDQVRSEPSFAALSRFYSRFHSLMSKTPTRETSAEVARLLKTPYGRSAVARTMAFPFLRQEGANTALVSLQTATGQDRAPLGYYAFRASTEAELKRAADSKRTVEKMAMRFGWDVTYPTALQAAEMLGDQEWSNSVMARCEKSGNKALISQCKEAKAGQKADSSFKVVKILGGFSSEEASAKGAAPISSSGGTAPTSAGIIGSLLGGSLPIANPATAAQDGTKQVVAQKTQQANEVQKRVLTNENPVAQILGSVLGSVLSN